MVTRTIRLGTKSQRITTTTIRRPRIGGEKKNKQKTLIHNKLRQIHNYAKQFGVSCR